MHASRRVLAFLSLVTLFAFTTPWAFSQGIVTGSLSGTIVDASGAAVSGATITATEAQTNRTFNAKTNAQGAYQIPQVPPGIYNVKIVAPNFEGVQYQSVQVNVGRDTSTGIARLKVGGEQQTVTVEGAAPLVETNSIQMQETFTARQASDLPLAGGFDQLALFVPGVVSAGGQSGFNNNNGADLSANGQRTRSNNFQIDGQANNDNSIAGPSIFFGNQDAIAELQVITNYTAEYGHNMGSVVNYVTKSGTNSIHGTAYEYHQNSAFDSLKNEEKSPFPTFVGKNGNFFCAPGQTSTAANPCDRPEVPKFIDNRFGGTVGGPIVKNKIWYFGGANFERQRSAGSPSTSGTGTTPTPEGIQALAAAFPNNPAVNALQQFGPFAIKGGNPTAGPATPQDVTLNGTTISVPFATVTRSLPALFNDYEANGRVDTQLTDKDRFFARYVFQQQLNTGISGSNGIAAGDWVDVPARDQQIGLDWTRNWTTGFFDQTRFSYSRANFGFEGGAHPECTRANVNACPPTIGFRTSTLAGFGTASNLPQGRLINNYSVQNNANWQKGRHAMKFGGEYDRQRSPNVFLPFTNGGFTFTDFNTFLANTPRTTNLTLGTPNFPFKENDVALYFQDDWRVKDNLTLNLGVRWEWFQQAVNLLHDLSVSQQTSSRPFWDPSLPIAQTTVPSFPEDLNNVGPVVGFAWTPRIWQGLFGQEKTVIRGGFRVAYDPEFYNMFLNVATSAPTVNRATLSGPAALGLPAGSLTGAAIQAALGPAIPATNPGLRSQTTMAPNIHNPYSMQWNFGVQRQINNRVAAEVRYVGNHTVGNFQSFIANPELGTLIDAGFGNLIPAGITPCASLSPNDPGGVNGNPNGFIYANCNQTNNTMRGNTAFSIYHSMQSELRIQNWHGFAGNVSYTFSKTIDNSSEVFSSLGGGNTLSNAQNPFDIGRAERGLSGLDFPHNLGVSLIYNLPFFNNQEGFLGKLLGGWQWNATYRYTSGQPYDVVQFKESGLCDPTNQFSSVIDTCRPIIGNRAAPFTSVGICTDPTAPECGLVDLTTGDPRTIAGTHWIINDQNAATAFGSPFLGARRNLQRGESQNAVNMGVFKNTKMSERLSLRMEMTVFNPFNMQYRGTPDPFVDDAFSDPSSNVVPTFGNTRGNLSGGGSPPFLVDTATNATANGIGRRRIQFGAKFIF